MGAFNTGLMSGEQRPVKKVFLSVCVLTYRRNHLLTELLSKLNEQSAPDWEVIVVDTSGEGLAKEMVEGQAVPWVRGCYPERRFSISEGRNLAVDEARGAWILFVDDDQILRAEQVEAVIVKIRNQKEEFKAARLGLQTALSENRSEALFENKLRKSGYFRAYDPDPNGCIKSYHLSTDGVVFKRPPEDMRFSKELGYRGGEDNDFFARYLGDLDCPVWGDIVIRDLVMPDRICLGYIWKDSYRRGCSYAQLETEPLGRSRGKLLPKYMMDLVGSFCLLAVDIVMWRDWPKSLGLIARQCGKMAGLSGRHYELYRDGNTNIS